MTRDQETPKEPGLVVFDIVRPSVCAECGQELVPGDFLCLWEGKPLCLSCADLAHLAFLPRGNTALTRRAGQFSTLSAVVVRFSRTRKRYERQGLLVEEEALARAEQACLADAEARARSRARSADRRARLDAEYFARFAEAVGHLYPRCPAVERVQIAEHACAKYSGRVGRSAAAKRLDSEAIELAVPAHIRHTHTDYGRLLATGWERQEARAAIAADVEAVLGGWQSIHASHA